MKKTIFISVLQYSVGSRQNGCLVKKMCVHCTKSIVKLKSERTNPIGQGKGNAK